MTDYTRLIEGLVPKLDGESAIRHRSALVDAVNSDGTVDLDFNGTIVPDVSVLDGAFLVVGDTVQVAAWAGDLLVLGSAATYPSAWADYAPTMQFATVVNGVVTGRVRQVGKMVDFYGSYTVGSSDTVSAGFSTFPPITPAAYYLTSFVSVGQATYSDISSGNTYGGPLLHHGTTPRFRFWLYGSPLAVTSATAPVTWATGDVARWEGRYEAA